MALDEETKVILAQGNNPLISAHGAIVPKHRETTSVDPTPAGPLYHRTFFCLKLEERREMDLV